MAMLVTAEPMFTTATASVGESLAVDLTVAAVTDLFGVAVTVHFDSTLVGCYSAVSGSFLPGNPDSIVEIAPVDTTAGTVTIGITRLRGSGGVSGDGVLATFHFTARAAGAAV